MRFRGDSAKNRRITCIMRRVMSISFRDLNLGPNVVYYFCGHIIIPRRIRKQQKRKQRKNVVDGESEMSLCSENRLSKGRASGAQIKVPKSIKLEVSFVRGQKVPSRSRGPWPKCPLTLLCTFVYLLFETP